MEPQMAESGVYFEWARYGLAAAALSLVIGFAVLVVASVLLRSRLFKHWQGRAVLRAWLAITAAYLCLELCAFAWFELEAYALVHGLPRQLPEPSGELHLVAIGGSTMEGDPYKPKISIPKIIGWQLQQLLPDRKVVVNNLAEGGNTLEQMLVKLRSLKQRPSVLLVYSGHNEFIARFPWFGEYRPSIFDFWHDRSFADRLLRRQVDERRLGLGFDPGSRQFCDVPLCSPRDWQRRLDDYRSHLAALVDWCTDEAIPLVLMVPSSNLADFEPNRSVIKLVANSREKRKLEYRLQSAREAMAANEMDEAHNLLQAALQAEPTFAETHFRLAQVYRVTAEGDLARQHFQAACDYDGFPVRAPSPFQDSVRQYAGRECVRVIDCPQVLCQCSPNGLLGMDSFHDQHHFSLKGMLCVSRPAADAITDLLALPPLQSWPSEEECRRHFEYSDADLADMLEQRGMLYRFTALFRYDPAARLQQAMDFFRNAKEIRQSLSASSQTGNEIQEMKLEIRSTKFETNSKLE